MSTTDRLVAGNLDHAASFVDPRLGAAPSGKVAVVACMDARVDVYRALGLEVGQAHVVRNAGGVVTDDVIRSLIISQRLLGTEEIVLVHHSDCGMTSFAGEDLADQLEADVGTRPSLDFRSFDDHASEIRSSVRALQENPFVDASAVRGFVYDVSTGRLEEVDADPASG